MEGLTTTSPSSLYNLHLLLCFWIWTWIFLWLEELHQTIPGGTQLRELWDIMSLINLGLQCVGMMWKEGSLEFEKAIKNANSLNAVREAAKERYRDEVKSSLQPPLQLLASITNGLELKRELFFCVWQCWWWWNRGLLRSSSSDWWQHNHEWYEQVDPSKKGETASLFWPLLSNSSLFFCVKKCGSRKCDICKPVRMDSERFKGIHFLPNPMNGPNDHYVPLADAYGTSTMENYRPSLIQQRKIKTLTYSPSEQHALNTGVLVQCDECDKWRLLFSKLKLTARQWNELEGIIADLSYSCGATTDDLILPNTLKSVAIQSHNCSDPIEKIYYSAYKDDPICIHCGGSNHLALPAKSDTFFPYCMDCASSERLHQRQSYFSMFWLYMCFWYCA